MSCLALFILQCFTRCTNLPFRHLLWFCLVPPPHLGPPLHLTEVELTPTPKKSKLLLNKWESQSWHRPMSKLSGMSGNDLKVNSPPPTHLHTWAAVSPLGIRYSLWLHVFVWTCVCLCARERGARVTDLIVGSHCADKRCTQSSHLKVLLGVHGGSANRKN